MSYGTNIYYSTPDDCEIVASEDQAGSWEFDMILFIKKGDEIRVFMDSGCSCPTPFDGVTWEDGQPVRDADAIEMVIAEWWDRDRWGGGAALGDIVSLRRRVVAAL